MYRKAALLIALALALLPAAGLADCNHNFVAVHVGNYHMFQCDKCL